MPVQNQLFFLPIKVMGDIDLRPKTIVFQSAEDCIYRDPSTNGLAPETQAAFFQRALAEDIEKLASSSGLSRWVKHAGLRGDERGGGILKL